MMRSARFVFGFLLLSAVGAAQQYVISTYAGGAPPLPTAPVAATRVSIGPSIAVAADPMGNVYFASAELHSVFKLYRNGLLTRLAGSFTGGFSGDGGPAPSARLNFLWQGSGVAADSAGTLFIADSGNHRIRRVSPHGIIATVAGMAPRASVVVGQPQPPP